MSHPQLNGPLSHEQCPAFESGCPFHTSTTSSGSDAAHPTLLSAEKLQELRQKCPAFKDAHCPFSEASDQHPTVKSLSEASKCPAFKDGCPLSASSSSHPDVSGFWSIPSSQCKAMQSGCPFKHATLDATDGKACPFLAGWKSSSSGSHPPIHELGNSAACKAFHDQDGCPFRAESGDAVHRLFGLDEEALATIKSKCPGFSGGLCPFAPASSAHPNITSVAQLSKCPAFKDGGCVFNAASTQSNAAHPNVGALFKNSSISRCSAFSQGGCPFAALGQPKALSRASFDAAKKQCPAMKDKCPFADVKTFGEFAKRWSEVPDSHLELMTDSHAYFANLMQIAREQVADDEATEVPADHPPVPPAVLEKMKKKYPNMQKGVCPVGRGATAADPSKRKRPSLSSMEFAHMFSHLHATMPLAKCPAFKTSCVFKDMQDGQNTDAEIYQQPLTKLVAKCPAFADGHCPFAG